MLPSFVIFSTVLSDEAGTPSAFAVLNAKLSWFIEVDNPLKAAVFSLASAAASFAASAGLCPPSPILLKNDVDDITYTYLSPLYFFNGM
jgi:hypothetical protein